ncbi:hypothetical protein Pfo_016260 [Paulownia fortunei]|nr:hypothetical protein Pfo_016260 [Paulownia fortunei]
MAHLIIKNLVFLFILSINLVQIIDAVHFTKRYEINIYDVLPQNSSKLITHCQSGDDDFGNHTLYLNQYQRWSFYTNIFGTTRFYCHFWWNQKQRIFDVFYAKNAGICETGLTNTCSWVVKADGFYFSPNRAYKIGSLEKMYTWQ